MRARTLAAIGIAAYLAFAMALMPARFVVARLHDPRVLALADAEGTFWNGSARGVLQAAGGPVPIDRIEWRFRPAQLMRGRLAFDVHAVSAQMDLRAQLTHGFDGLGASDVAGHAEAALASAFFPLAAGWRPEGQVTVAAPRVAWDEREIRGDATAEWRGARLALPQFTTPGDYRAELHGAGGPARLTVSTLAGDYVVRGEGTITPARLDVKGQAGGADFAIRLP